LPITVEEFAGLIQHPNPEEAGVEIQDLSDWDTQGEYGEIANAVEAAVAGNDMMVYRVPRDGTRVEYFLIGREGSGKHARLVGVKALSVES